MGTSLYKGFSTVDKNKKFKLNDFELVKRDLINHLMIRKGEKLMNPEFGSNIWKMLFEQFSDEVRDAIKKDLLEVAKTDPRLSVDSITVTDYEQGIMVELDLTYIPTNEKDHLYVPFMRSMSEQ